MPRRNRNPGAGKAPFNGPARAAPDSKSGPGWGGPAQGEGAHNPRPRFKAGNSMGSRQLLPEVRARAEARKLRTEMEIEAMRRIIRGET
jgi:hypothetical protein